MAFSKGWNICVPNLLAALLISPITGVVLIVLFRPLPGLNGLIDAIAGLIYFL